ncbi:DUF2867 domain-containing protein [Pacificoceanicola onchidii]|uniref:DUF2867 domain-containing protein n=1 Tax=Pacificoceanicola onchidii TaxID=2562685 RepID=UPI0010A33269|nr:DUF2867 domain-containing protein [Pacificoceanicola onchidii]
MPITKTRFPETANLWTHAQPGDFVDGYAVRSDLPLKDALTKALRLPGWANALLSLRNLLVAPLGLKTGPTDSDAIFPVTYETEQEINIGINDRHLDFRIGLARQGEMIHMATWVHPHNLFGRAYLILVMPFHILITRTALRRLTA